MGLLLAVLMLTVSLCSAKSPLRALGKYYVNWDGGMRPCDGANNSVFDLSKLVVEKKSRTVLALVGTATLQQDADKLKYKLTIYKDVNGNYEYLMTVNENNLCKHIAEEKKPWTPIMKEMGVTGCPVPAKSYKFTSASLDTGGFPFTAAQAGHYRSRVELIDPNWSVCMIAEANVEAL